MQKNISIKADCRGMFNEEIIETILDNRGIKDVEHFLNPVESDMLPLNSLYRIDEAANIFIDGIQTQKKFFILFDTDQDGCACGAMVTRYLKSMGAHVDWTINHGKVHGCNDYVLDAIKTSSPDIVIIVDSLDATIDYYKAITQLGCQIICLDHHDISEELESEYDKYMVLVSSNRHYSNPELSGAGVVFKFLKYVDNMLGTCVADEFWDLACVGILADVMNIDEDHKENRYIVNKGLNSLTNPMLKKVIGSYQFDSQAVLYSIAPLINAANRYDENEAAAQALLADDNKEVLKYLRILKKCKEQQAQEIDTLLPDLIKQCQQQQDKKLLFCTVDTVNGISGLLATKLCEMFGKQVIVVKETVSGYAGSLRGVGVDLRSLCDSTECGAFNGHPQAAGVMIPHHKYDEFRHKMEILLSNVELKEEIDVDIELDVEDMNTDLVAKIKKLSKISGNGFKPIKIAIKCDEYEATTMSQGKHLVLNASSWFKFIKWNAGALLEEYEDHAMLGDELYFIGTCDAGYLGRDYSVRLILDDIIAD